MSDSIHAEITGFRELTEKVKGLANDKKKFTEIKRLLRVIAGATVRAAKREVPIAKRPHYARKTLIQPKTLQKSIGTIDGKNKENPTVAVGPRAKGVNKGWYGHFVNNDTNVYRAGFRRKHAASAKAKAHNATGAASVRKGNPFMARAYEQTKGTATAETADKVAKYIQKRIDALSTR